MSNSPLVKYTKLSPNHSGTRTHSIDRITPHCVVGQLSAESICSCFTSTAVKASCNYGIGTDGKICLVVDEKNRSWCSSSNANDQRAVTIECASGMKEPFEMNDAVYKSLVELCVDICRRNKKTRLVWISNKQKALAYEPANGEMLITVHRWFAEKSCPGNWLVSRLGELAETVTNRLNAKEEDEELTIEQFKALWLQMRKELQDNDASNYSETARQWAINNGILQGGTDGAYMWEDMMTREQLVTVLYRFAQKFGLT